MRKFDLVKENVKTRCAGMKEAVKENAWKVALKLKEQKGSILEYLGEHIIGVVIVGIVLAALALIIGSIVVPGIEDKIKSAFTFSA